MTDDPVRVAFVCVENAGRSQMAAAFAERAVRERDLGGDVEVVSGGTDPADHVHEVVVDAMAELDIDIADREPRMIPREEIMAVDYVITMGCSAEDVCPATWRGDSRDWDLDDPGQQPIAVVREIRDEIEERVAGFLDELERGDGGPDREPDLSPRFDDTQ